MNFFLPDRIDGTGPRHKFTYTLMVDVHGKLVPRGSLYGKYLPTFTIGIN